MSAESKEPLVEAKPLSVYRLVQTVPIQDSAFKSFEVIGIRDMFSGGRFPKRGEFRKLPAAPLAYTCGKLRAEITEERKGLAAPELLAHKQERWRRGKEQNGKCCPYGLFPGQIGDALPESPVSHLVVVLQERDKSRGRKPPAGLAAAGPVSIAGRLTLVGKTLGQTTTQMYSRVIGIIAVIAFRLSRKQAVNGMVYVVIPLGRVPPRPAL